MYTTIQTLLLQDCLLANKMGYFKYKPILNVHSKSEHSCKQGTILLNTVLPSLYHYYLAAKPNPFPVLCKTLHIVKHYKLYTMWDFLSEICILTCYRNCFWMGTFKCCKFKKENAFHL